MSLLLALTAVAPPEPPALVAGGVLHLNPPNPRPDQEPDEALALILLLLA